MPDTPVLPLDSRPRQSTERQTPLSNVGCLFCWMECRHPGRSSVICPPVAQKTLNNVNPVSLSNIIDRRTTCIGRAVGVIMLCYAVASSLG